MTTTIVEETPETSSFQSTINEAIERIKAYGPTLEPDIPIEMNIDGSCEGVAQMAIGAYARQGKKVFFTETFRVGHGTCNEAEYIAAKTAITILRALFPCPKVPIKIYTDSQLMALQVNGLWRVKQPHLKPYYMFLRQARRSYPFEMIQISREQNEIADSLSQNDILKNQGKHVSIDNEGRFRVKGAPAVKQLSYYNAVTSDQFRNHLSTNNLNRELRDLLELAADGEADEARRKAHQIRECAQAIIENTPTGNLTEAQWLTSTAALINKSIDLVLQALDNGDDVNLSYLVEELSGQNGAESQIFAAHVGFVQSGLSDRSIEEHLNGVSCGSRMYATDE